MTADLLQNALIYLGTALVCVPISKKLGIGSVLGYLIGGILVGPFVLGFIGKEGHDVMHTAEFGVVMMLFVIGLELNPEQFWKMRKNILGLGGLQMLLTTLIVTPLFLVLLSLSWQASLALALACAMSSTAIVLQTLKEKGLDKSHAGESAFSVLLFQDIAVIPILALIPLLALHQPEITNPISSHDSHSPGFLEEYPSVMLILAVLSVVVLSKYVIPYVLRAIAKVHMRELFTTSALFFVIGIALLMEMVGVSAALGAFMAGVLLANSEFRHELEADINPFKGLLLGIFFTAVGSTINFDSIATNPLKIIGIVGVLMMIKALVLLILGWKFKLKTEQNRLFALLLCQVGEFAFVLLTAMGGVSMLSKAEIDLFMAVITISMMISRLLLYANELITARRQNQQEADAHKNYDTIEEKNKIILLGFGHFGSTIGRFLRANKVEATIIDADSDRVNLLRKMGFKVFYGDDTRLDILESAGAHEASILISTIDNPGSNKELAELLPGHFPNLKLFVRAKNSYDAYELMDIGIKNIYRESIIDSVYMGVEVLNAMGFRKHTLFRKAQNFIRYDNQALHKLYEHRDSNEYVSRVREEIEMQEQLLKEDSSLSVEIRDKAWEAEGRTEQ